MNVQGQPLPPPLPPPAELPPSSSTVLPTAHPQPSTVPFGNPGQPQPPPPLPPPAQPPPFSSAFLPAVQPLPSTVPSTSAGQPQPSPPLPPPAQPPPYSSAVLPAVPPLPSTVPSTSTGQPQASVFPASPPPATSNAALVMPSPTHASVLSNASFPPGTMPSPMGPPFPSQTAVPVVAPQANTSVLPTASFPPGTMPSPMAPVPVIAPQANTSVLSNASFPPGTMPSPMAPSQTAVPVVAPQVNTSILPNASFPPGTMPSPMAPSFPSQTAVPVVAPQASVAGLVVSPVAPVDYIASTAAAAQKIQTAAPMEAAFKIQRWWKSQQRRARFLKMIRRAIRRRTYLNERRSLAQRVHTQEVEAEEMKSKLAQPKGHRLVGLWQDTRTEKAATRVQSLWRSLKAKKHYAKRTIEMDREVAARKLQAFLRRRKQRRLPNPLLAAARENPAAQPMTAERLFKHEETILKKVKQYTETYIEDVDPVRNAAKIEELRRRATEKYRDFIENMPNQRADLLRTLLHKEHTRQMIYALEGRGWDNPIPYGACSASLLQEAEDLHRERKNMMEREIWAGVHGTSMSHTGTAVDAATEVVAVESHVEAAEADELLWGLERDLGYDFSARQSQNDSFAASRKITGLFQQPLFGGALR